MRLPVGRTVLRVKTRVSAILAAEQHRPVSGSTIPLKILAHEPFPTEGINPAFFSPPPWFWLTRCPLMNPVRPVELKLERYERTGILTIYTY
jgi:hypothetical protein